MGRVCGPHYPNRVYRSLIHFAGQVESPHETHRNEPVPKTKICRVDSTNPPDGQITSVYQKLSAMPRKDLVQRYEDLQRARDAMAIQKGKIKPGEATPQETYANVSKEQIIEELMVEYLKLALGKPSPIPPNLITGVY